jgi:hypothetical protein
MFSGTRVAEPVVAAESSSKHRPYARPRAAVRAGMSGWTLCRPPPSPAPRGLRPPRQGPLAAPSGTGCHVRLRLRSSSPPFGDQIRDSYSIFSGRLRSSRRPEVAEVVQERQLLQATAGRRAGALTSTPLRCPEPPITRFVCPVPSRNPVQNMPQLRNCGPGTHVALLAADRILRCLTRCISGCNPSTCVVNRAFWVRRARQLVA